MIEEPATGEAVEPEPPAGGGTRILIIVAATLVVLLVGAAGGMLLTLNKVDDNPAPGADSVDVGFAQDMRVHHLQAVTMAGITRDKTTDKEVQGLAFDIESTQLGQLSAMGGWLTVWVQPELPPPGADHMVWMRGSGGHEHGGGGSAGVARMPGMATSAELNELRKASGKELDVLFLQLMLRHHQGGYEMAQYAAEHASQGYVRNMAQKIVESQGAEARLMEAYLAERGAQPLPFP